MFTTPTAFYKVARYVKRLVPVVITIAAGATSGTATIAAVDATRTSLHRQGNTITDATGEGRTQLADITLTNSTTVTATRGVSDATDSVTVYATLVEWSSSAVSRVQYGTVTIASGSSSGTASISSVNTSATGLTHCGQRTTQTGTTFGVNFSARITLTNDTTVTASRSGTSGALTVGFCIIEYLPSIIQSIQYVSVTSTAASNNDSGTISAVNLSNTIMFYNGVSCATNGVNAWMYRCRMFSTTIPRFNRAGTSTSTRTNNACVVEFKNNVIKNNQFNTSTLGSGTTSGNTSITAVDTSRTLALWQGSESNRSTNGDNSTFCASYLSASDNIITLRNSGSDQVISAFSAVTFN